MTKICTCWPGNHFTESFYLQTFSVARAKERESHRKKKPTNKTHSARERENDRRDHRHRADRRDQRASQTPPRKSASIAIAIAILPSFVRIWWFFSRFCLCFEEWMILCIRLVTEKMWATSRKCVYYGIFKNTTKHQKIFSETFFEMQPNTWKHFLFRKIAFSENIYFPKILLHEPNAA